MNVERRKKPLFSVLIANYNNGQYLSSCIGSVLAQTYPNWEIVIVDDCSTDGLSSEIYEKYMNDERIKVFYNIVNQGCGYTKNKCAEKATGAICGFLDPDDELTPDAIEIMVKAHQNNSSASLIYSNSYLCDEELNVRKVNELIGPIPENKTYLDSLLGAPLVNHFATFKRELYYKTEKINPKLQRAVDQDLYYKLEEVGALEYIDKPLYYYRYYRNENNDGIATGTNKPKAKMSYFRVLYNTILRRRKNGIPVNSDTLMRFRDEADAFYIKLIKEENVRSQKIRYFSQLFKYGNNAAMFNYKIGLLLKSVFK